MCCSSSALLVRLLCVARRCSSWSRSRCRSGSSLVVGLRRLASGRSSIGTRASSSQSISSSCSSWSSCSSSSWSSCVCVVRSGRAQQARSAINHLDFLNYSARNRFGREASARCGPLSLRRAPAQVALAFAQRVRSTRKRAPDESAHLSCLPRRRNSRPSLAKVRKVGRRVERARRSPGGGGGLQSRISALILRRD